MGGADELDDDAEGFDWVAEDGGEVVFLDDHGGFADFGGDGDPFGDGGWSGEERVEAGRDPRLLPPNAPRSRVLASLLALAVVLGVVGASFTAAYHRHLTDQRIANLLALSAAATPPTIPDLASLGFQKIWRADLEEQVVVPVLNQSPEPVELLGAVLEEPGMSTAAALKPVGATRLTPGQTGRVAGLVKVDCTQDPASVYPYFGGGGSPGGPGPGGSVIAAPTTAALLVRAQTAGGRVAEAALDPDDDGPDLQERICQQEGYEITGVPSITAVAVAGTHEVRIDLTVASSADIAMDYQADADYTRHLQSGATGLAGVANPEPALPASGTVQPGHALHIAFDIQVLSCPPQALATDQAYVQVLLTARGNEVDTIVEAVHLATPLAAACGTG